jgi:hypothetical protein
MTKATHIHCATNYPQAATYHLSSMVCNGLTMLAVLNKYTNTYQCLVSYNVSIDAISTEQLLTDIKLNANQIDTASAQLFDADVLVVPNNTMDNSLLNYSTTDNLTLINAQTLYNVAKENVTKLQHISPSLSVHHHTSIAITNALTNVAHTANDSFVTLTITNKLLHICVIKNGVFTLSNYYEFKHLDDVVYYTLFTYNQLQLSNTDVNLYLYASLETANTLIVKLNLYIQNIHTEPSLPLPYTLDSTIPTELLNQYYPLLIMLTCV